MKKVFTAESVELAKEMAAREFGTSQEKITFTVLKEPKKSLFGKVKEEAEIEAEYEVSKARLAADYIRNVFEKMGCENVVVEITEIEGYRKTRRGFGFFAVFSFACMQQGRQRVLQDLYRLQRLQREKKSAA